MGEVSPIAPIDEPSPQTGSLAHATVSEPSGPPPGAPAAPSAAPSAFGRDATRPGPSVSTAQYDPHTGTYVAPDGQVYRQSDLVPKKAPKTWKDMFAI
jgi:hypothetical protein